MKRVTEAFTDEEFERLKTAKENKSWHDFIMQLASHVEVIPKVSSLSPKRWLKIHKGIEWNQFIRLPDQRRKELMDEYVRLTREEVASEQ